MLERLTPTWRNFALIAIAIALAWFCWTVREVLNPVILGYLFAYVVHPLVERLEKSGWSRRAAVNMIFIAAALFLFLTAFCIFWQGKQLAEQVSATLSGAGTGTASQLQTRLDSALADLQDLLVKWKLIDASPADAAGAKWSLQSVFDGLRQWWSTSVGTSGAAQTGLDFAQQLFAMFKRVSGSLLSVVSLMFLFPIYTYFLLFELERIHAFVRRYLPRRERERISRIASQVGEVLSSFFRGRLVVCMLKGVFLSIGLAIAGVPFALLLGFIGGVLALVPVVGPVVACVVALLIAFIDHSISDALLRVGVVYAAAELLEGYFLTPKILGDSLGLHPVVVILALTIGGAALGLFGLLVALPLTATIIILVRELVLPGLRVFADDAPPPPKT